MIDWYKTKEKHGYGQEITKTKSRFSVIVKCHKCGKYKPKTIRKKSELNNQHYTCIKCKYADPEYKKKQSEASKRLWEEKRDKILSSKPNTSQSIKEKWQDPEYRNKVQRANKKSHSTKEYKDKASKAIKEKWQDPEYKKKQERTETHKAKLSEKLKEHFEHNRQDRKGKFIEEAKQKHDNKYDYNRVNYINSSTPVTIICPEHGEFEQRPTNHLSGFGCLKCGKEASREKNTLTADEFVRKANQKHNNRYDYKKVDYISSREPILITCERHGGV